MPSSTASLSLDFVVLYSFMKHGMLTDSTKLQPTHVGDLRLRCFGRALVGEAHARITTCSVDSMSLYLTSFHIFCFTHVNVYDLGQLFEIPIDTRVHMFWAGRGFRGPFGALVVRARVHIYLPKRIQWDMRALHKRVCDASTPSASKYMRSIDTRTWSVDMLR